MLRLKDGQVDGQDVNTFREKEKEREREDEWTDRRICYIYLDRYIDGYLITSERQKYEQRD